MIRNSVRRPLNLLTSLGVALGLAACSVAPPTRPDRWSPPEAVVPASAFKGVHGLAVDGQGRLLAGSVVGNAIWEVDRASGATKVFIGAPQGQADDIAVGPGGELAWTAYLQGALHYRERDETPVRVLASGLPGLNSLAFDRRNGKLYATQVFLGDALWEIDVAGQKPPRLIAKDLGGLNGFEVGPDGLIYGPLWFKGQVVKVDPSNGKVTTINHEFKIPAAANLDGQGHLWVVDTQTGELSKVELASGRKTVVQPLNTSIDNLAIAPDGTVYVSNMADNSVQAYDPATGRVRTLTSGKVAVPGGLEIDGDTLYLADLFAFRQIDVKSGAVRDIFRMHASDMEYPFSLGVSPHGFALTSWFTGTLQIIDRATLKTRAMIHGLKAPSDVVWLPDGSLVYAELGTGTLTQASGPGFEQRKVIATGLEGPVQLALARDGAVYVTEAAGKLWRVMPGDGSKTVVASGLALPEGVAPTPWGTVVVAEAAARRLTEIDPATGAKHTVAEDLPIGFEAGPGMPAPYIPTGVAVGADGTVYFSADRDSGIYRVRPGR
ncbi:PQQ-binding-like beta-propeller repeat protein [Aquabacterium sp. A7-Y]|uniref:outer membrane protein assembly factor BamB family protein n=1 Tax=Aquabacterium sp. A7-Y TaxID=1349605 RepID=UPI00223DE6FF|nr:PQQ-binding-like beta-propeller repeat protein [Aquabacterium sp. A7-Y]MCW7538422.1 PQQ-binding-like beta-propeller repeat protein [Aquabacterium sp. A7-Y]